MRAYSRSIIAAAITALLAGATIACRGESAEEDVPIVVEEDGPIALGESLPSEPTEEEVQLADERTEIRIDCGTVAAEGEPKEQIQLQLRREGGGDDPIQVSLPQFERPAGMSDEEFRNHIVAELRARGVETPK